MGGCEGLNKRGVVRREGDLWRREGQRGSGELRRDEGTGVRTALSCSCSAASFSAIKSSLAATAASASEIPVRAALASRA
jgi:hypothetical protein